MDGGWGLGARGLMKGALGGPRNLWGAVPGACGGRLGGGPNNLWGAAVAAPPAPLPPHKPPELIQNPASMLTMCSTT